MLPSSKLTIDPVQRDVARSVFGALQNLIEPAPGALTLFEDGPGGWRVEAYYAIAPNAAALAARLESILGQPAPPLDVVSVPDLNWVAMSQAALPPVTAGRFVIRGSHDRGRVPHGPNTILIDAAEAFGTAHHATTLGCLLAIDRLTRVTSFHRVLDLGCGSGILAIAAARALPKAAIFATDHDAQSVAVTGRNMRANGVNQRIVVTRAHAFHHQSLRRAVPFDLVIANILAGPLCALAANVTGALHRGGILVLSGILNREAAGVIATYRAQGFAIKEHRRIEGWSTLTFIKRS